MNTKCPVYTFTKKVGLEKAIPILFEMNLSFIFIGWMQQEYSQVQKIKGYIFFCSEEKTKLVVF